MYNITHCFLVGAYISKKEAISTVYERETEALSSAQKIKGKRFVGRYSIRLSQRTMEEAML